MNDSEYDIIHRYQWEDRGLVEYYGMAQNLAKLSYILRIDTLNRKLLENQWEKV